MAQIKQVAKQAPKQAPKNLAVIGYPITHSRSPLIHNFWLAQHTATIKAEAIYESLAIAPEADFEACFADAFAPLRGGAGLWGANITIPYKEKAFAFLAHHGGALDGAAQNLRAVNTIYRRLDTGADAGAGAGIKSLAGANTDGAGFMAALAAHGDFYKGAPCVVLGAGGAARAIVAALLAAGVSELRLCNRTRARAQSLADDISPDDKRLRVCDWHDAIAGEALRDCALLVNASVLGMQKQEALPLLPLAKMRTGGGVFDIVYTPLLTPLLQQAGAHNLLAIDGLGMLLHQAALAFELWFGVCPPVDAKLRALLEKDLQS